MATNELDRLYVSQCIFPDYCKGWNAAVEVANKTIERLEKLLDDKCDRCIERDVRNGIKIAFDETGKCMVFGSSKGAYIRLAEIEKIKKELTGKE